MHDRAQTFLSGRTFSLLPLSSILSWLRRQHFMHNLQLTYSMEPHKCVMLGELLGDFRLSDLRHQFCIWQRLSSMFDLFRRVFCGPCFEYVQTYLRGWHYGSLIGLLRWQFERWRWVQFCLQCWDLLRVQHVSSYRTVRMLPYFAGLDYWEYHEELGGEFWNNID